MSTLAEIIAEGKRLEERYANAVGMTERLGAHAWRDLFYQKHGATLLAVAEAAVESITIPLYHSPFCDPIHFGCQCGSRAERERIANALARLAEVKP